MAITPHKGQIATMWAGPFTVDSLLVPCYGAADPPLALITGSLAPKVLAAVYAPTRLPGPAARTVER